MDTTPGDVVRPSEPESGATRPSPWVGGLLNTVAGLLIVLLAAGAAVLAFGGQGPSGLRGRRRRRHRDAGDIEALPEISEPVLSVDAAGARAALSDGAPRNAIVACWIRLERDAAGVGLERSGAETPSEYVERVVASSSVDPAPIAELAGLYREARFSQHELTEAHRARAARALDGIVATLNHGEAVSS